MSDRALVEALEEIREVWAGAECGEPVHAQEAYAIHLCKQMYAIAVQALGVASGPGSPLQPAVSAERFYGLTALHPPPSQEQK